MLLLNNNKTMTNENENEKLEEEQIENKVETPIVPPVAKFTRPPAYIKWNNNFRWNQNNFTKQVQRKASWRGR